MSSFVVRSSPSHPPPPRRAPRSPVANRSKFGDPRRLIAALPGVQPFPSEANMILARVPDAAKTFDGLKAHKVLIKNVSKMHPLLANCLRLTVGTAAENDQLLAALKVSL